MSFTEATEKRGMSVKIDLQVRMVGHETAWRVQIKIGTVAGDPDGHDRSNGFLRHLPS